MFGRATIRLGIGPHSSYYYYFYTIGIKDPEGCWKKINIRNSSSDHYSGQSSQNERIVKPDAIVSVQQNRNALE